MLRTVLLSALVLFTQGAVAADDSCSFGLAGLLSGNNKEDLPEVVISVGKPLGGPWELQSGTYYEVEFTADGTGEIALDLGAFSRAIWIDEVVINDLEVRPYGVESIEFDDDGTMELGFIAIKPGNYVLKIPGSSAQSQRIDVRIK